MLKLLILTFLVGFISTTNDIVLEVNSCPQVLQCRCVDESVENIECFGVGPENVKVVREVYGAGVKTLSIKDWQDSHLDFNNFAVFPKLWKLSVYESEVETINATKPLNAFKTLILSNNYLESDAEICRIIQQMPNLEVLKLNNNYLTSYRCDRESKLINLDLKANQITALEMPSSVQYLNISDNLLTSIDNVSSSLLELDVSSNKISSWPIDTEFTNLRVLNAAGLKFRMGFELIAPKLEELNIDDSLLRYIDFYKLRTPMLKTFSGLKLNDLRVIAGKAPKEIENMGLTTLRLHSLPGEFFEEEKRNIGKRHVNFKFEAPSLECQPCLLQWSLPVFDQSKVGQKCNITKEQIRKANCTIGVSVNGTESVQYGKYNDDMLLRCYYYSKKPVKISWYRYRPSQYLGKFDSETHTFDYDNVTDIARESYKIMAGGALFIMSPNRSHIERYVCVAENSDGKAFGVYHFRLDYTDWYSRNVFRSVFWGGLATSFIVCMISFLLNITWILTRKSALWWIQRAERLSRVRKMVEAMEKYRVRQMESLHEKYTKRVQIVRDNYHQQVEALRVSYAAQHEKFQNYRAAQFETVHSHLDSMRDGYNNQLARVRDYGSKRADQLWESYERQVNRMRTFSLQHRLKLMRQYKVKQRYVNKLLESFQASSPEVQLENEEKVRAALDIPDDIGTIDGQSMDTPSRLSRSSSFHSLPEYVIDEMGNVRPGIPASSAIRFSPLDTSRSTFIPSTSSPARNRTASSSNVDVPSTSTAKPTINETDC